MSFTKASPLVLVWVGVDHTKEAEFNAFYHHRYLPKLLQSIPEIESAWRYTEHNVDGSLRYYSKKELTIYQARSGVSGEELLDFITLRPGPESERAEWEQWKAEFHFHEAATVYHPRYVHPRKCSAGPFGLGPFFMVSVEVRAEEEERFNAWYEGVYLPCNLSDVPTWTGCRRYRSQGRDPARTLTVYQARDVAGLALSLESMRAPHRLDENASWQQWDSGPEPVITFEDAASYRPIFRYP